MSANTISMYNIIITFFQIFLVFGVAGSVKSMQCEYSLDGESNSASNEYSHCILLTDPATPKTRNTWKNVMMILYIDIVLADIPYGYGLILNRDWSARLNGYFASDWSHLWLPQKGSPNQIKILREPHMKHNVT